MYKYYKPGKGRGNHVEVTKNELLFFIGFQEFDYLQQFATDNGIAEYKGCIITFEE